ncbi:ATP-utilizing chromatin assembly and remodelling N-terminal family protein [Candida parapsilosis]|uniref:WAC domain-containing protein n=2 Tax=Candida parapsilosis TaxID=5480 RepID=G8B591_CANPC|nr:uncharacterized protein CPAR2_602020 [Candida parapsilosis]KAF6043552.1 ATP-utilizing chromatin assembly and remodelling N-terminal family protein [Candida parapsilosis]KAF6043950.1 ATP-utilizing chromatin assembly and remodelling N-terminal family protein [Candida parapsilosis]KAF6045430.1 ATP-utilizing chromatin assembly and remodelling N-terminal family protein [Candida parapsilosis]KAF6060216.1 ATP-utilizing chromatin assembly and remodelling N-terminal family protein [Candida parapsilos
MVLYKRKQVPFVPPPPTPTDPNTQVWFIPNTKEWFLTYEEFLERMDFYNKRKFVCEITGNSCLTYFEALQSEANERKEVDRNFPENLREHILRYLQFNQISRLDQLIDKVYSTFKNDYFPGEVIFLKGLDPNNQTLKSRGVIREKVQYAEEPTKYLVIRSHDKHQAIVTGDNIVRDRNHFTKWLIKTFIKLTMSRSHKVGAPWVVKAAYAKQYGIPTTYPEHLRQYISSTPTGEPTYIQPKRRKTEIDTRQEIKIKPKIFTPSTPNDAEPTRSASPSGILERKKSKLKEEVKRSSPSVDTLPFRKKFPVHHVPVVVLNELENAEATGNEHTKAMFQQPTKKTIVDDLTIKFDIQNVKPKPKVLTVEMHHEDNEMMDDNAEESPTKEAHTIPLKAVQEALQVWVFMNVYHNVLNIDTFTFDDFITSLNYNLNTPKLRSTMVDEIYCALLCKIVSNEVPSAKNAKEADSNDTIYGLNITIPQELEEDIVEDDEDDEEEKEEEKEGEKGENEIEVKVKKEKDVSEDEANGDRGSDSETEHKPLKVEDEQSDVENEGNGSIKKENRESEEPGANEEQEEEINHSAYEYLNYRGTAWHDRLRKRNFKDGNWQIILVGVLSLVEHVPKYHHVVQMIFESLAPAGGPVSASALRTNFYEHLDINLKLYALCILTDLLVTSPLVRNYIEESLEQQTSLRRTRLENIKEHKTNMEVAIKAQQYIVDALPPSVDSSQELKDEQRAETPASTTTANGQLGKQLPLGLDLQKCIEMSEREREYASAHSEFAEQCELRKAALLKLNEIKENKKILEQKLNEFDCQRIKLLGKDRLFNRYWWFENNGMPTLHKGSANEDDEDDEDEGEKKAVDEDDEQDEENGDIHDETYLMGRLWVQGPCNTDIVSNFKREVGEFRQLVESMSKDSAIVNESETIDDSIKIDPNDEPANDQTKAEADTSEEGTKKKNQIKQMNFIHLSPALKQSVEQLYQLKFTDNEIHSTNGKLLVDQEGSLQVPLDEISHIQRKFIEEYHAPILNSSSWRYYDEPEDINKLMSWLNPWGRRESALRKELLLVKDAITSSMEARQKALYLNGNPTPEEQTLSDDIKKLQNKLVAIQQGREFEREKENLESGDNDSMDLDTDDSLSIGSKRRSRSRRAASPQVRKKPRLNTVEDVVQHGDVQDIKNKINELNQEVVESRREVKVSRVCEWVNSKALDSFGKSIFEGGDRAKKSKRK